MPAKVQTESQWLNLAAAARLAGVGRTSFHDAAARGEIPFATCSLGRLFKADDITKWQEERDAKSEDD